MYKKAVLPAQLDYLFKDVKSIMDLTAGKTCHTQMPLEPSHFNVFPNECRS